MRRRFHFSVYSLMLQFWCISGTLKVLLPGLLWRTPRKMKLKLMTIGMTLQMMTRPFLLTMQNPKGEIPWLPWKSSFREKNHVSKLSYWPPLMVIVGAISDLTTFTFSPLLNCYLNNQTQNLLWWPVFIRRVSNTYCGVIPSTCSAFKLILMYIRTLPASYKGDFCWGDEANLFLWQNPTRIWLFDKFKSFLTSEASFECIWTSDDAFYGKVTHCVCLSGRSDFISLFCTRRLFMMGFSLVLIPALISSNFSRFLMLAGQNYSYLAWEVKKARESD